MKIDIEDLENARIKYSSVLDLKNSEGEIQWNRYNAMLVVNTIFIGFIGFTYNKDFSFPWFFKIIFWLTPVLGLLLCHLWYKMTERGFMWSEFWMTKANEIENQINGKINPIKEGKKLRDIIGAGATKNASFIIINVFALIYVLMLINNILSLWFIVNVFSHYY